jgi:hypothetical protein
MAALVTNRNTLRKGFEALVPSLNYGIKGGSKVFLGGMVAIDATGYIVPMTAAAGLNPAGVVGSVPPTGLDNTGGANGAISCEVRRGIFLLNAGTAADAVTQANIGLPAYAMDDNTVSPVATGRTKVGVFTEIDASGQVWVQITGPI